MLRIFCIPRATVTLFQCLPKKFTNFSKSYIFYRQRFQLNFNFQPTKHGNDRNAYGLTGLLQSYCTSIDLDDNNNEADGIEIHEMLDESNEFLDNGFMQIKDFLYNDLSCDDEFLVEINNCCSEDELLNKIENNLDKMSQQVAVLAVVKLYHCSSNSKTITNTDSERVKLLLRKILQYSGTMSIDELCICFQYLTKLSVKMQSDVMQNMLELILKIIDNGESADISLSALSRFAIAVKTNHQLCLHFICKNMVPHIYYHLDRVASSKDLRLITICLNNISRLIPSDLIQLFRSKVHQLIEEDKLKYDSKTILKILQFLSYKVQGNLHLTRMLLLQLSEKIHTFSLKELEFIGVIFQSNFEPAAVGSAIATHASELLEKNLSVEAMSCAVLDLSPKNRPKLAKLAKELLFSKNHLDRGTLVSFFKVLRLLKISDTSICNEYWSSVKNDIVTNPSQQDSYFLARYCHHYMHFNNNLNGTYRHIPLEKAITKLLIDDFDKGISALLPMKFARASAFILAYGHTPHDKYIFPEAIVQKIESMQEQFTIFDCLQLTRGIEIALQMRFKQRVNSELATQILRLENVFNGCTERHLQKHDLSLNDLNIIARSYANRKSPTRTTIYHKIIQKYATIPHHHLTSRIIRDVTFNLNVAKYNIPSLCDSLSDYIIANHDFVLGDTVQKVLLTFYNLNYQPRDERIFQCATDVINRDFDGMSGLAVVEACLALAFYKELPGPLIDRVFNISFIQRLEDEIEMCYSKEFYPQRVLNSVMQLNRAVCLDFPENGVPWFQQNYIEAQLTKVPLIKSKFHMDVKHVLIDLIADENLLKFNDVTPYGYRIDFVLYFDKHKKLLKPPTLNDAVHHQVNKLAILLLNIDSFCQNGQEHQRGKETLKKRHLEIMGFKVAQISYFQWNSMYMSLPGAKIDYVKELLS